MRNIIRIRDGTCESDETERGDSYIFERWGKQKWDTAIKWTNEYRVKDGGQVCFTRELSNSKQPWHITAAILNGPSYILLYVPCVCIHVYTHVLERKTSSKRVPT